jgi:hypothetical protein
MTQDNDLGTPQEPRHVSVYIAAALFCIALIMFGDLVFQTGDTVISHRLSDGSLYFTRMRDFGFSELANGNMPLWNPHIYSGTPFVGAFQSGMFYPPNVIYMALPVANAFNTDNAVHVFLMSFFMYLWARKRGLSWGASLVAGILLAYGGAGFVRVMAGHITMLQALSWAPLILLSIDHIVEKRSNGWMLVGIGATTMQILAGHPQSLFMTATVAALYSCIRLASAEQRIGILVRFIPFGILPPLLACVQLWTGWDTAAESIRSGGVGHEFATTFSFHPEHLLTYLMPALFGNSMHSLYWGRWAFWDATVFIGIGGLVLMMSSLFYGPKPIRRFSFTLFLFFSVLAFGSYTPLLGWVFELPGFNNFRSPSKFMFPASIFAAMLAGIGMDAAIQGKLKTKPLMVVVGVTGVLCLFGTIFLGATAIGDEPNEPLRQFIDQREPLDDTYSMSFEELPLPAEKYIEIGRVAFLSALIATISCLFLFAVLWSSKTKRWVIYMVPVMAVLEVLIFARAHRATFELAENNRPDIESLYELDAGEFRLLDIPGVNNSTRNYSVGKRKYSVWGYDPVILERYAHFVAVAASGDKREFDPVLMESAMWGNDPIAEAVHTLGNYEFSEGGVDGDVELFKLLRCRYIIINSEERDGRSGYWQLGGSFPRFFFSNSYSVHDTKDSLFNEMKVNTFDPSVHALVESEPVPKPAALADDAKLISSIDVVSETTDSVEFEITVNHNTLLIITDSYSKNWRAFPLENSVQDQYDVMAVDYTLRGIPLAAGHHHFVLEYAPNSYTVGRWVSLISLIFYLVCCVFIGYQRYSEPNPEPKENP